MQFQRNFNDKNGYFDKSKPISLILKIEKMKFKNMKFANYHFIIHKN